MSLAEPASQTNPGAGGPAWRGEELENPHARADKAEKVRRMFAAIARSYDLNNRLHAMGLDVWWRRAAVRAAGVRPGDEVLDVACGTGDLTQAFAALSPAARVIGVDFTEPMLELARVKRRRLEPGVSPRIEYRWADAQALPFEAGSFDVVSIAFGLRNVQSPEAALGEFARVLRPGGRLVILEFSTPRWAAVRWFNGVYAGRVMPVTATLISGDRSGAYRYLPRSVRTFAGREELSAMVRAAGFSGPVVRELSLGIAGVWAAVRA